MALAFSYTGMGNEANDEIFSVRQRLRRWKSLAGVFHLLTVCATALCFLWLLPQIGNKNFLQIDQEAKQQISRRQLLLEALNKMVRYQRYYSEVHGRYTRDLSRLLLPEDFSSGKEEELRRNYEISMLEVRPNRFLLLATGLNSSDRITMDESHRISANFVLPAPTKMYLVEEADRMLRLKARGTVVGGDTMFFRYWRIEEDETFAWVAVGIRQPVLGERRDLPMANESQSIFASVRQQMQNRLSDVVGSRTPAAIRGGADLVYKHSVDVKDVQEWLDAAHLAQHVHFRERGRFAQRWEDLDAVSGYHFIERIRAVTNLRVRPIDIIGANKDYQIVMEGIAGELLGEQFVMDRSGQVRQVRYTETLIQQLQETTNILGNFQINPVVEESDPAQ